MLIREKIEMAFDLLEENDIDCWLTFVRESAINGDPMLDFLVRSSVTWHSAFILTKNRRSYALVGEMDRKSVEDLGVYSSISGYVEGIKESLTGALKEIQPASIAVNFSKGSEIADGITHGMYLTLVDILSEIGFEERIVSAEDMISSLRARKTPTELDRIKRAVAQTEDIFRLVKGFITPGRTEKDIAAFMLGEVAKRGLELAWDAAHCPAVFTGPDTAGAHYSPTDRTVERGHILNMDFGVKVEGYCSDLQRTFYVLEEGETGAPPEVQKGLRTIVEAIELARRALRPGVLGHEVDAVARGHLESLGYDGFPHGLGHQVGRFAHDGTALLGPPWEKYAQKPFHPVEEGMVFTLEPRLTVSGRGVATIEEMVVVTASGAEFLSTPQRDLLILG